MTIGNPENFKVQIKTGREEIDNRIPCDFSNLTLKKLFAWIDSKNLSSVLKSELKKSASSFPHQALPNWQKSYDKHLSRAQARIRKKKSSFKSANKLEEAESMPIEEEINQNVSLSSNDFVDSSGDFENFDEGINE